MTEPTRIRTQLTGDIATVRVLMGHAMETGLRKDANGQPVPAWFIREVTARLNGETVLAAQWGPSVAKNPFLQFNIRGVSPGDRISLTWVDSRGEQRSDEALVS